tara:strand:+ start:192 stop:1232 length:1041 start_codon:yes stop_codon:yes gene_type:complete
MKLFKQTILILIIFLKTGNLLSENNLFNVNNIFIEKKDNISNKKLANLAIQEAFDQLLKRILLKEDISKLSNLNLSTIRGLVTYYNISKNNEVENNKLNFNITFDKDKFHDLFYKNGISYSDINDKEFYILPILLSEDEIFVFSNNFFYKNWNETNKDKLIEFILPLENIEIIENINKSKNNLLNLDLNLLFKEYSNKNIAIVFIENRGSREKKIYLKTRIQNKIVSKNLNFKKNDLEKNNFYEKIIFEIKEELINLVKSQNLIDIRTPSFLNVKLNLDKKSNLVILSSRIKKIDLIEDIFVQEFNKDYVNLKIKYLGKLEKIINQFQIENISLQLINNEWFIKTL